MVQADISQLSSECKAWRETLRTLREDLQKSSEHLQRLASKPLSKDQLQDVEHYHNQFHIQLINIHDLKQAIKAHDRKVNFEVVSHNGQLNEETVQDHEKLYEEYQSLEHTIQELKDQFRQFAS